MEIASKFDFTESQSFKLSLSITSSLFLYLFLVFFQPFGVNNYKPSNMVTLELAFELIGLIPIIFLIIYLNEKLIRPRLILKPNLQQLIPWFIWELILVGSGSFMLYNFLGDFHDFSLSSYVYHIFEVSSVLIFPFFGTLFYFRFLKIKKDYQDILSVSNEKHNSTSNKSDELVLLSGDYKKDQIAVQINKMVVIQSEDNYVGLNYLEDNKLKKYLIRSTLNNIEKLLSQELVVRCNRSQIVNLNHLESYKKVSHKLLLKINHLEKEIIVSRSNYSKVINLIQEHLHIT
jgi:hypothetical protein